MAGQVNQVRIIAGRWRGRRLRFPSAPGLRPTADRIRETLFNWLAPWLPGAACLDLFAGSGALGFEAASRGAACVVMVEREREVVRELWHNRGRLDAAMVEIVHQDGRDYLCRPPRGFDVVFLDAPFDEPEALLTCLARLAAPGWLRADARIYLETPAGALRPGVPENWQLVRDKRAGRVAYQLYAFRST